MQILSTHRRAIDFTADLVRGIPPPRCTYTSQGILKSRAFTLRDLVKEAARSSSRLTWGQTKQRPIVGAGQGLVQPSAKLLGVDLSVLNFCEHDSADQYLAAGRGLALAQRVERPLARIEPLLTKLELREFLLQGRNLVIEFGHRNRVRGQWVGPTWRREFAIDL